MTNSSDEVRKTGDPLDRLFPEYLEEVSGDQALDWVRAHNSRTEAFLDAETSGDIPSLQTLEDEILAVLEDPARIPMVNVRGKWAYNFWTDGDNPRGLWRRQRFEDYLAGGEEWEVIIDVDALARVEDRSWVWRGAQVRYPDYDRALITLSDGGTDAAETREFDMGSFTFVEDGFFRPEAKGSLSWIDLDHCWLTQPMDEESTSPSGYPLQARILGRGEELQDSRLILAAPPESMGTFAGQSRDMSGVKQIISVMEDFYTQDTYLIEGGVDAALNVEPKAIPVPRSAEVAPWNQWAIVWLRDPWDRPEISESWPSGSLLALQLEDLFADADTARATPLFVPTENEVLEKLTPTRDKITITTIRDVVSHLTVLTPTDGDWERQELSAPPTEAAFLTTAVGAVTPLEDDRLWVVTSGYTQPSTLWLVEDGSWTLVRQAPTQFDAEGTTVTQHFATSKDGTKIPYFQISKDPVLPAPTLLYGYGGFDVSLLPSYNPVAGRAWVEKGGVYVVANIRGGGEYGPEWHKSALREQRHRAYEDFAAVARDLVARGVTTAEQLGAHGGSNGGLLMGNMYTRYSDDFGAILCEVPLLDMGRYHTLLAGSSWVAEYGDPEKPEDWEFIQTFSPVHLFDPDASYPPLMLMTSTKDDRVHPAHARALGHLAQQAAKPVLYYENIEGGHAGAADNRQLARKRALGWQFLWRALTGAETEPAEG